MASAVFRTGWRNTSPSIMAERCVAWDGRVKQTPRLDDLLVRITLGGLRCSRMLAANPPYTVTRVTRRMVRFILPPPGTRSLVPAITRSIP